MAWGPGEDGGAGAAGRPPPRASRTWDEPIEGIGLLPESGDLVACPSDPRPHEGVAERRQSHLRNNEHAREGQPRERRAPGCPGNQHRHEQEGDRRRAQYEPKKHDPVATAEEGLHPSREAWARPTRELLRGERAEHVELLLFPSKSDPISCRETHERGGDGDPKREGDRQDQ